MHMVPLSSRIVGITKSFESNFIHSLYLICLHFLCSTLVTLSLEWLTSILLLVLLVKRQVDDGNKRSSRYWVKHYFWPCCVSQHASNVLWPDHLMLQTPCALNCMFYLCFVYNTQVTGILWVLKLWVIIKYT